MVKFNREYVESILNEPEFQRFVDLAKRMSLGPNLGVVSAGGRETDRLPRIFGDHELIRLLGQGGMGRVYLARHLRSDRQVALKIIRPFSLPIGHAVGGRW